VHVWSKRIFFASLLGIVFLTLFPFRFEFHTQLAVNVNPFLLGISPELKDSLIFGEFFIVHRSP